MSVDGRLQRVFSNVMDVEDVTDSLSVTTVENWDSQTHIVLMLELEKEFGVSITPRESTEMLSVPEIKATLQKKGVNN